MDTRRVPLNELKFGHEHEPPLNARKVGREANVDGLAASLKAHGLGQPLTIHQDDQGIFVVDGNRRLKALRILWEAGDLPADYAARVDLGDGDVDGDELSLALNFEREAMHEADTYEKFQELHDRGLGPDQIAMRFGVDVKRVRKFLALGQLHPDILEAWRNDELSDRQIDTIGILHAFTLAPTVEEQGKVFAKLKKDGGLWAHTIRRAFGAVDYETAKALKIVGLEAYKASGGNVTEDLFGDEHVISDAALVVKLADEKLKATVEQLRAEGWSWAEMADDLPYAWTYSWTKLPAKQDADKKRSGCVVAVGQDGTINITYGVVNPSAERKASEAAKPKNDEPKVSTLSDALRQRLSVQLTKAVQIAIVSDPHLALAGVLAGLTVYSHYSPFRVQFDGMGAGNAEKYKNSFKDSLARFVKMTDVDLMAALAIASKEAISLEGAKAHEDGNNIALTSVMDGETLSGALIEAFDAEDYFKAAPKPFAIAAIEEAINVDEARKAGKLKKADLVTFCVDNVPKTGWLPKELRTIHYTGPGAAKPKSKRKPKVRGAAE